MQDCNAPFTYGQEGAPARSDDSRLFLTQAQRWSGALRDMADDAKEGISSAVCAAQSAIVPGALSDSCQSSRVAQRATGAHRACLSTSCSHARVDRPPAPALPNGFMSRDRYGISL